MTVGLACGMHIAVSTLLGFVSVSKFLRGSLVRLMLMRMDEFHSRGSVRTHIAEACL